MLRDYRHAPGLVRRLFGVMSQLAETAATMSWDSGKGPLAQRYYLLALRAAKEAEDRQFGANILAGMARQLLYAGRTSDALELVRLAHDGLRGQSATTTKAMLYTREAWCYAKQGRTGAFRRATDRAEETISNRRNPADDPYWIAIRNRRRGYIRAQSPRSRGLHRPRGSAERVPDEPDDGGLKRARSGSDARVPQAVLDQPEPLLPGSRPARPARPPHTFPAGAPPDPPRAARPTGPPSAPGSTGSGPPGCAAAAASDQDLRARPLRGQRPADLLRHHRHRAERRGQLVGGPGRQRPQRGELLLAGVEVTGPINPR